MNPEYFAPFLYRSACPKSQADYDALASGGFVRVVDMHVADSEEADLWARRAGVRREKVPCCPVVPPSKANVALVMDLLRDSRKDSNKTLLCCHKGVDRTGFMVATWRMWEEGWDYAHAMEEYEREGASWWLYWWFMFLNPKEDK